jgi:hypothetical protein
MTLERFLQMLNRCNLPHNEGQRFSVRVRLRAAIGEPKVWYHISGTFGDGNYNYKIERTGS